MSNKIALLAGLKKAQELLGFRCSALLPARFTLQTLSKDQYRLIMPGTKEGKDCIAIIGSREEGWLSTQLKLLMQYQEKASRTPHTLQIAPIIDCIGYEDTIIIIQEMRRSLKKSVLSHYPVTSQEEKIYIAKLLCNSARIFPRTTIPYTNRDFFMNLILRCCSEARENKAQQRGFISDSEIGHLRELFMSAENAVMSNFFSDINETLLTLSRAHVYLWNVTVREYPVFFETALWLGAATVHAHTHMQEWIDTELYAWLSTFVNVYEKRDHSVTILPILLRNLAAEYLRLLTIDIPLKLGIVQKYNERQLQNTVAIVRTSLVYILQFL